MIGEFINFVKSVMNKIYTYLITNNKKVTMKKKWFLTTVLITGSMMLNAQTVKVTGTAGTNALVDIQAQTIIRNYGNADGLDIIRSTTGNMPAGSDLIWGAFYQNQPNNPGIFTLTSTSAGGSCFTVRANGNTGIFNSNPSVAFEIGSSSSIRQMKVNGNIVFGSDMRMKENIRKLSGSLSQLNKLQSVAYNFKEEKKEEIIPEKLIKAGVNIDSFKAEISKAPKTNEDLLKRNFYGFLAQDVQKLFPDLVYTDDAGMLSVDYIGIIPLLLSGLQEQQQLIDDLQQKEAELTKEQQQMQQEIKALKETLNACCKTRQNKSVAVEETRIFESQSSNINNSEQIILYQNAPNPFNEITNIQCYIPVSVKKAELCIFDMKGTLLKCIVISEREATNIQIQAGQLTAGVYTYVLIGDGKTSDAKTMIITR
jgi:hypothetical protein